MRNKGLSGIVTLLTDFGLKDGYVGAMKGVILSHAPDAKLVDITHDVPCFDLLAAALILDSAFPNFPEGSIHVVVVDPAVGSSRRHLLVEAAGHIFIGPDNGIPGRVAHLNEGKVFEIAPSRIGAKGLSNTFHGRDVYTLAAGRILAGTAISSFVEPIKDHRVLKIPEPRETKEGVEGEVIYADHFGNFVTNLKSRHLSPEGCLLVPGFSVLVRGKRLLLARTYFDLEPDQTGLILNSWGYYEIARNKTSAARVLGIEVGEKVLVVKNASVTEEKKV